MHSSLSSMISKQRIKNVVYRQHFSLITFIHCFQFKVRQRVRIIMDSIRSSRTLTFIAIKTQYCSQHAFQFRNRRDQTFLSAVDQNFFKHQAAHIVLISHVIDLLSISSDICSFFFSIDISSANNTINFLLTCHLFTVKLIALLWQWVAQSNTILRRRERQREELTLKDIEQTRERTSTSMNQWTSSIQIHQFLSSTQLFRKSQNSRPLSLCWNSSRSTSLFTRRILRKLLFLMWNDDMNHIFWRRLCHHHRRYFKNSNLQHVQHHDNFVFLFKRM